MALGIVIVIALGTLVVLLEKQRREAEGQISKISVQSGELGGSEEENREAAKRIILRVSKHYALALDPEPTVATIVDVDTLKARNAFYAKATNGDHLILTSDRAILYDPETDIVLDVIPVQLRPATAASAAASARSSSSVSSVSSASASSVRR